MKVSVLIMTYNHELFIRQAVESVLNQKTNFEFEILISEDCSKDKTREIVKEYKKLYPETISLLLSDKNIKNNRIVTRGIEAAKGKYIALLDGDDYWTSSDKLQKQTDFLDEHSDCTICFHNALVIDEENKKEQHHWTPDYLPQITTMENLWQGNYIATSATMFRNGVIGTVPEWYTDFFPITDWPLHLLNAEQGKIGFINETMSVYRIHKKGMYSPYSETRKQDETLNFYNKINHCLKYKYDKIIKSSISKYFFEWAEEYYIRNDYQNAKRCAINYYTYKPFSKLIPPYSYVLLYIKLIFLKMSSNKLIIPLVGDK